MPTKTGRKSPKSQAQMRLMYAAAKGKVKGVSRDVGREFVRGNHGKKMKRLPEKAATRKKRGRKSSR